MAHYLLLMLAAGAATDAAPAADTTARVRGIAQRTEALARLAAVHEAAGRWREALAEYAKAVRVDPADRQTTLGYARCLHQLGRHEEAHNALAGAEYIVKDFKAAQELHRKVHRAWAAIDPKILALDRQLKDKPDDPTLLLCRYRRLQEMQATELAEADVQTVLKAHPRHAEALWLRGRYTRGSKGWNAAHDDLKAAAALAPTNYTYGREFARCLNGMRREEESKREMARINKLPLPTTAEGWEVLATEVVGYGRYSEAIQHIDKAIKLEPANPRYHFLRGRFIRLMNDKRYTAGAQIHLREAERLVEVQGGDRLLRAQIQFEFGKVLYNVAVATQYHTAVIGVNKPDGLLPQAIRRFDRAIELEPHSFGAYIERGLCHFAIQQWDAANADFGAFLAANPQSAPNIVKRAGWWSEVHEIWRAANADLQRQLEAGIEFRRTHSFCGTCYSWQKLGENHDCDLARRR